MDGENGKKVIVYNTEEEKRKRREKKTGRIVYSQVITLEHIRGQPTKEEIKLPSEER